MREASREIEIAIKLQSRGDGGLRVYSDDVPGLILSHSNPDLLMRDVLSAIRVLRPDFDAALQEKSEIPEDIRKAARAVVERGYNEGLIEAVERALMAERERAAKIAKAEFEEAYDEDDPRMSSTLGDYIANAIRSDHTASMEAAAPGYLSRRRAIKEGE